MFPGIADRMNKEITARAPTSMKVKVSLAFSLPLVLIAARSRCSFSPCARCALLVQHLLPLRRPELLVHAVMAAPGQADLCDEGGELFMKWHRVLARWWRLLSANTLSGLEAPSWHLCPPSSRCGLPRASTTSLAPPLCIASASSGQLAAAQELRKSHGFVWLKSVLAY